MSWKCPDNGTNMQRLESRLSYLFYPMQSNFIQVIKEEGVYVCSRIAYSYMMDMQIVHKIFRLGFKSPEPL